MRKDANLAKLPFKQAADAWLETRLPFLSERTQKDYAYYIKVLNGFFSVLKLSEITSDDLRKYQRYRMPTAIGDTINKEVSILRQLLERIGRWDDLKDDYQVLPRKKEHRGRALAEREAERLFRYAMSRPTWEIAYLYTVISLNTSMRPKEVFTLRRQDVDMNARTIQVRLANAKNPGSARINYLNEAAFAAVDRALQLAERRGSTKPEHYIFPFRLGGNCYSGNYDPTRHCTTIKTAWSSLTTAANLKGLRPYDMRHTAITNLLMNPNISIETAKSIAGHITDQIIKTYSHIHMDAKRKALDALMGSYCAKLQGGGQKNPPKKKARTGLPEPLEDAEVITKNVQ